jgi:hypothetical protein
MAHSIELLLDDHSDAAIRQLWAALDDAGLPSQLRVKSATNRPHITMLAAERITPDVDAALAALVPRFPLDITIGAPVIFTGARLTLARLGVASEPLLDLHREVYQRCLQHAAGEPYRHSAPGYWTPHVTLGRRLTAEDIGTAIQVIEPLCADISARIAGLRRWDGDQRVEHQLIG